MAYELTIFDCDGVLVDSEILAIEIEGKLLRDAGFPYSDDEIAERFVGLSYPDMMLEISTEHGRDVPEGLQSQIRNLALEAFPTRLQPVSGIAELLGSIDHRRCVASSSKLDRIRLSLGITGLDTFFHSDHLFSTEMVSFGKPAPDVFLHAASQLGVDPSNCVVIEDSAHGVAAATAAGMDCVGFVAGAHCRPSLADRLSAAGAGRIVTSADQLVNL